MSVDGSETSVHRVSAEEAGTRLDRYCAAHHPERSRSQLAKLIRDGAVLVDGAPAKPGHVVDEGAEVRLILPPLPRQDPRVEPEPIPLTILFEDDDVIVLEKPAGLVVHPGAGVREGTLVAALLHHDPALAGVGGEGRGGLVHRLDRGTTGLLLIARHGAAHRALTAQFRERSVDKIYRAIVWGRPREASGVVDLPIGRDPKTRTRMSARAARGRTAQSEWTVLAEAPGFAQLAVRILTGRTHQIRVHLQAVGHPIVGDALYGGDRSRSILDPRLRLAVRAMKRPALHAEKLAFTHPRTGERCEFESPIPDDMSALWRAIAGAPA